MDGEFDSTHMTTIRYTVARLVVADVRGFNLRREDREELLAQLGYSAQVSIVSRPLPILQSGTIDPAFFFQRITATH
jgi:hypothetical protein